VPAYGGRVGMNHPDAGCNRFHADGTCYNIMFNSKVYKGILKAIAYILISVILYHVNSRADS